MHLPKEDSLLLRLHRAIREYPRYNRFLVTAHDTALTPVEAHILVELDSTPDCLQKDLGSKLGLDKVSLSRIIARLQESKYVASKPHPDDRRQQFVMLTQDGRKLLALFDTQANTRLHAFIKSAGLSSPQVSKLASFFNRLADALQTTQSKTRRIDHVLRAPIRRLTRAFGLLGEQSLGSELTLSEWQVLLTVSEHSGRFTPTLLSDLLDIDKTVIAVTIRTLKKRSLIVKKTNPEDSRSEILYATKLGLRLITKIELQATRNFAHLPSLREEDLELVERFIRGAALDFFLYQRNYDIIPISEEDNYQAIRRLKVAEMNSPTFSKNLPGSNFSEDNICVGLYQRDSLLAAIELKESTSKNYKKYKLVNLYMSHKLHPDSVRGFILVATSSKLTSSVEIDMGAYVEDLHPAATVSSTLGSLF